MGKACGWQSLKSGQYFQTLLWVLESPVVQPEGMPLLKSSCQNGWEDKQFEPANSHIEMQTRVIFFAITLYFVIDLQ
jgi:hypothetical protein